MAGSHLGQLLLSAEAGDGDRAKKVMAIANISLRNSFLLVRGLLFCSLSFLINLGKYLVDFCSGQFTVVQEGS